MQRDFWESKWTAGQIGFHQDEVQPWLRQHGARLGLGSGQRVLVPLCGKSGDLRWLRAQGARVVGVEWVRQALEEFCQEQGLDLETTPLEGGSLLEGAGYRLYCGDFLRPFLREEPFLAWYDRASLIALEPDQRAGYVQRLTELTAPGGRGLMLALEYPQPERRGPPFSLGEAEVRALFDRDFEVELLEREDLTQTERCQRWGLSRCHQLLYQLTRR